MNTARQCLESFFEERAAAYAQTNVILASVFKEYFGEPLLKRASDFMPGDKPAAVIETIVESSDSASVIVREDCKAGSIRTRFHLCSDGHEWRISRIEHECFHCGGSGSLRGELCKKCSGQGWHNPRTGNM